MRIIAAAFAALALPLACYGIDFSTERNFQITIYCGNTPVTLQDPGFSKVESRNELDDLVEKKLREAFLSEDCQQLIRDAEVDEGACPLSGGVSTTSSTGQPKTTTTTTTTISTEPTPAETPSTKTTKSSGPTATTGSTMNPVTATESTEATHDTDPPAASQGPVRYSFRSYADPNRYIGANPFPTLVGDETFYKIITPGLQETTGTISFENRGVYLNYNSDKEIRNDEEGYYAYESFDQPNHFISYDQDQKRLVIDEPVDDQSKEYASFLQLPENNTSLLNITCTSTDISFTLDAKETGNSRGWNSMTSVIRTREYSWLSGLLPCIMEITKIKFLNSSLQSRRFAAFTVPEYSTALSENNLLACNSSGSSIESVCRNRLPALATKIAIALPEQKVCQIEVLGRMNDACGKNDPKPDPEMTDELY